MFKFEIMPDDGDAFRVDTGMRDSRLWEKSFKGRSIGMLSDPARFSATVMFEIAYAACQRQRKLPEGLSFDRFVEGYDIDMLDTEVELTPEYEKLRQSLLLLDGLTHDQARAAATAAQALDDESEAPDPLSTHPGV